MFTPKEVSEKAFPKASFGGYNMVSVDEFLDTLTEDYSSLYRENATLKAKMKVLAEKVEEYRATEDAMRSTLLAAQKMATQMVQEAQTEKDQILENARKDAADQIAALDAQTRQAQQKLSLAQQQLTDFITRSRELCVEHAAFLDNLPEMKLENTPSQEEVNENDIRTIEQDILKSYQEESSHEEAADDGAEEPEVQETAAEPEAVPAAQESAPEKSVYADFNLDELKFGRNYNL